MLQVKYIRQQPLPFRDTTTANLHYLHSSTYHQMHCIHLEHKWYYVVHQEFVVRFSLRTTSVKLAAELKFFCNEYSHIHLCLSSLSVYLVQLDELYLIVQLDFR